MQQRLQCMQLRWRDDSPFAHYQLVFGQAFKPMQSKAAIASDIACLGGPRRDRALAWGNYHRQGILGSLR